MLCYVIALCLIGACAAARVLVVFPVPDREHSDLGDAVVRTLLAGDHEVTYVSVFPKKTSNSNLTYVDISSILTQQSAKELPNDKQVLSNGQPAHFVLKSGPRYAKNALQHEAIRQLIHDPSTAFDAVVLDWFYSGLLAPLASLFDCPLIWYVHGDASGRSLALLHEQPSAAYSVDLLSGHVPAVPFTAKDRAYGLGLQAYYNLWAYYIEHFIEIPAYDAIFRTPMQLRKRLLPNYEDVVYNGSLLLVNSHPPLGQTLPLPQNVKLIGGHHIREPIPPLAKSLQAFMDNTKKGVIFINLGNLQRNLPHQLKTQMLDALSQLEYLVLWQLEDPVEYVPKNIRLLDRAPQLGILCHPSTVLFVTDGSLSSLMETTHCGVPFVAVPSSGEQNVNVDLLVGRLLGRKVQINKYLPWTLQGTIEEVLRDPNYSKNMKEASAVFKSRIQPPTSELLYWVNLVIETRGATHLRSPAVTVPALERYHADLWVLFFLFLWFLSKAVKVAQVHLKDLEKKNK
ncbi:UDP-glucuronosyltransferase 3A1-like [Ostrinia furnacalis]|uniref:UDP-glucuronosyltransferase 3A1-like n=1 Tax=Ostrinia furnacalis TaxID=93504 RepID=UPI00103EF577|nr:UDP-glucuronosyltransferase 3A1-like [Ostrinia furnacalis]